MPIFEKRKNLIIDSKSIVFLCALILLIFSLSSHADDDKESSHPSSALKLSGYLESYYVNRRHNDGDLPSYVYSYQQTEQVNINLGLIQAKYSSEDFRANLGLASGTFMRANYAKESGILNNLFQANIGFRLSDDQKWWLDMGVLPSHIGLETAKGNENWALTRSLMADNSPYFETGAKLSFTSQDKRWTVAGLVLNGWQRIRRQADNTLPAIGHLISYQSPSGVLINSSSFIGSDTPDHDRKMRYFHHFNMQIPMTEQLQIQLAWDIGAEQIAKSSSHYHIWHAPLIQARYQWNPEWSMTARVEVYRDPQQVIIQTDDGNGFRARAFSSNLDFRPNKSIMYRVELKKIDASGDDSYQAHQTHDNLLLTTLLALEF